MSYRKCVIFQLIDLIEESLYDDLSMDKLSNLSGYSKWHLQRLFQNHVKMRAGTYIRHRRLSRAAVLLKQSKLEISEIAKAVGFSSQQSFSRAFHQYFAESPHKFRMNPVWDFSKQLPPCKDKMILEYDYVSLPLDNHILQQYNVLRYQPMNMEQSRRRGAQKIRTWEELQVNKYYDMSMQSSQLNYAVPFTECFYSIDDFSLPYGKYLSLNFKGRQDEYYDFYKKIYDLYLPKIGVKVINGFILELYSENINSANQLNIGVLILLDNRRIMDRDILTI